jgi:putative membrane protein
MHRLLATAILAAASFCFAAEHSPDQPQSQLKPNPRHVPCEGWNNPAAYPGSSDCYENNNDDKAFARDALLSGLAELELANLAEQKGASEGVKRFAKQLADDFGRYDNELRRIADENEFSLPEVLDAKHKAELERLAKLSGSDFDRAFIRTVLKENKQDFESFQNEGWNGMYRNARNFAWRSLPAMKKDIKAAKALRRYAGAGTASEAPPARPAN